MSGRVRWADPAASLYGRRWLAAIGLLILSVPTAGVAAYSTGSLDAGAGDVPQRVLATWTVTKTADTDDGVCDSDCSLREAVDVAAASGDTIVFDGSLSGATITLAGSEIELDKSVDIDASALASPVTVSGGGSSRIFYVPAGHIVLLRSLVLREGDGGAGATTGGGAIRNDGTLTLEQCTVSDSSTAAGGSGGGILTVGGATLTLTDVTFSGNSSGGGGGAISNGGSTVTVNGCTFVGNSATGGAPGAAISQNSGSLTMTNSTINGNTNSGGRGTIRIAGGSLDLISSTVADNSSTFDGGLSQAGSGAITVTNSIVADNSGTNCSGTITNGGNNIDSGTSCGWGSTNGSMSSTDPLLTVLADWGGPTQTMALRTGSPAIGGVTFSAPNGSPATDQRGVSRPQGALYDIGAYERAANGAVQLVRFEAARRGRAVKLTWETSSEIKHAGFRVLRETPDGDLVVLTPQLIRPAAPGGELGGASYAYVDRVAPRAVVRYWLEDVDTLGTATRHGPVQAPAYRSRPIRLPSPPGGNLDGMIDPQELQSVEVLP